MIKQLEAVRVYQNLRPKLQRICSDGASIEASISIAIQQEKEPNQRRMMEWLSPVLIQMMENEQNKNHSKSTNQLIKKLNLIAPDWTIEPGSCHLPIVDFAGKQVGFIPIQVEKLINNDWSIRFLTPKNSIRQSSDSTSRRAFFPSSKHPHLI